MGTKQLLRGFTLIAMLVGLVALTGCGDSGVHKVRGKLLYNGQPYQLIKDEQLQITFSGKTQDGKSITGGAKFNEADSTFVVEGPKGEGIPPGTYKIGVTSSIYGPKDVNRLGETFEIRNTPLTYQVTEEPDQKIVVDLDKKSVTRQ